MPTGKLWPCSPTKEEKWVIICPSVIIWRVYRIPAEPQLKLGNLEVRNELKVTRCFYLFIWSEMISTLTYHMALNHSGPWVIITWFKEYNLQNCLLRLPCVPHQKKTTRRAGGKCPFPGSPYLRNFLHHRLFWQSRQSLVKPSLDVIHILPRWL